MLQVLLIGPVHGLCSALVSTLSARIEISSVLVQSGFNLRRLWWPKVIRNGVRKKYADPTHSESTENFVGLGALHNKCIFV